MLLLGFQKRLKVFGKLLTMVKQQLMCSKAVIGDLGSMDDKVKQNQIGVGLFATRWEDMGAKAVLGLTDVNGGLGDVNGRMDEMKTSRRITWTKVSKCIARNASDTGTVRKTTCRFADVLPKAAKGISDLC